MDTRTDIYHPYRGAIYMYMRQLIKPSLDQLKFCRHKPLI